MRTNTTGRRLFLSILVIFVLFAAAFVAFQYQREKQYKVKILETQLQEYNNHFAESMRQYDGSDTIDYCQRFIRRHEVDNLHVVITRSDSTTLFATASTTASTARQFFVATAFPQQNITITSALPYDLHLSEVLATDRTYLYFALLAMLLLCVVLYRYTASLGRTITNLRLFATRIDHNEPCSTADLRAFADDELGEIAEQIVRIYMRLEQTKHEQDRLKRELTHNIAHELNTPTACIMGYLETILDNKQLDDSTRRTFLAHCYAQATRLSALVKDISLLNKMDELEDTRQPFEEVDLCTIINQILADRDVDLQQRQMSVLRHTPATLPSRGDRTLLYSIFNNLIDNAIKYAGEGTTITITATDSGNDRWIFTVADNGSGVEPKHRDRLFERFYRVDKGRSRAVGGTGLGLAIVKNAVLLHEGTIKVTPTNGDNTGLTFHFSLPKT